MRLHKTLAAIASLTLIPTVTPTAQNIEAAVAQLSWREIGPTIMGGRIADIAVVESNPATFYVGAATGGLWKTTSNGIAWEPLFEDQPTSSIGDVTLAPSNPNLVWVGTGEPQNRRSSPWSNGVYKSADGGRTWRHRGLENTHHISCIAIHPTNPDAVFVAAVGHVWGPNPERGVYKTTDGGETWELVLFVDEHTGAIDLVMDPGDPQTLFAAMYQRRRTGFGFNGGGPGSGIYRTTDGGDLTPDEPIMLWWLAQAMAHGGRLDEAREVFARVAATDAVTLADTSELYCQAAEGDRQAVAKLIEERTVMVETAMTDEWFPNFIASCLVLVGDEDGALEWLGRAIDWGFCNYRYLEEYNPFLKPLHENPRFRQLIDKARQKHEAFDA